MDLAPRKDAPTTDPIAAISSSAWYVTLPMEGSVFERYSPMGVAGVMGMRRKAAARGNSPHGDSLIPVTITCFQIYWKDFQ